MQARKEKKEAAAQKELEEKFFSGFAQMFGARELNRGRNGNNLYFYFKDNLAAKYFTYYLYNNGINSASEMKESVISFSESYYKVNLTGKENELQKKFYRFFLEKNHFGLEDFKIICHHKICNVENSKISFAAPSLFNFLREKKKLSEVYANFKKLKSIQKLLNAEDLKKEFHFLTDEMAKEIHKIIEAHADISYHSDRELFRLAVTLTIYKNYYYAKSDKKAEWRAVLEKELTQAHGSSSIFKKLFGLILIAIGGGIALGTVPAGIAATCFVLAGGLFYDSREKGLAKNIRNELKIKTPGSQPAL